MAEKETIMVLKVDLQCTKCYKKVKKLLCKYPQIRDQSYDEKANTVTIKVVCCSPENIRDKLCCKGGGTIKSIDIKEPPKPNAPQPEKQEKPEAPQPEKQEKPEAPQPEKQEKPTAPVAPPKDPTPVWYPQGPTYPQYGICYIPPYWQDACGYGMGVAAPPPCNCGCGGSRWVSHDNYWRNHTVNHIYYFSEENPSACTLM